jgi:hypothetical protein
MFRNMADSAPKNPRQAILDGVFAARMLAAACETPSRTSLKAEVVRDLARETERDLEAAEEAAGKCADLGGAQLPLLAEAAGRCADLATLAACNAGEVGDPGNAAETVRLAAGAALSLSRAVERGAPDEYARRNARSASWKSSLAIRQVET